MSSKFSLLMLLVCCCLAGCKDAPNLSASSAAVEKKFGSGPVQVTVRITPGRPVLEDKLVLLLQACALAEYQVQFPNFSGKQGLVYVDFCSEPRLIQANPQTSLYEQSCHLEPLSVGKTEIPRLEFRYLGPHGSGEQAQTLVTEPIPLEIVSRARSSGDVSKLQEIRGVWEFPGHRGRLWLWLVLASGALTGGCYWWWQKRKLAALQRQLPQKSPGQIALEHLEKLLAGEYLRHRDYQAFYFALTGIVRQYLENAYQIRAPRQTTEEFLATLCQMQTWEPTLRTLLQEFMSKADLVKYAAQVPAENEIAAMIAAARKILV